MCAVNGPAMQPLTMVTFCVVCLLVGGAAPKDPAMQYVAHSGMGNQRLQLLHALQIAVVLKRTLLLPPVLAHKALPYGSCNRARTVDAVKLRESGARLYKWLYEVQGQWLKPVLWTSVINVGLLAQAAPTADYHKWHQAHRKHKGQNVDLDCAHHVLVNNRTQHGTPCPGSTPSAAQRAARSNASLTPDGAEGCVHVDVVTQFSGSSAGVLRFGSLFAHFFVNIELPPQLQRRILRAVYSFSDPVRHVGVRVVAQLKQVYQQRWFAVHFRVSEKRYNTTADRQVALMMEHAREMVKSRLWRRGGGAGDGAVFLLTDLKAKALEEHEGFHDGVRALQALVHNATARRLWLKRLSDFPTEKKWGRARFQALPAQEADAIIESYVAAAAPGGFVGAPDSTFAGTIRQLREYTKAYE